MKIFVSGASGFAGSHFVEYVLSKEKDVICKCLVRKSSSKIFLKKQNIVLCNGDLLDIDCLNTGLKNCEVIVHYAACIDSKDKSIFEVNVRGTENLLKAAVKSKVKKFIFISSADVYGLNPMVPVKENSKICPQSKYAKSKIQAEQLVLSFAEKYSIEVVIFRPGSIYGERNNSFSLSNIIFSFAKKGYFFLIKGYNPLKEFAYAKNIAQAVWQTVNSNLNKEIFLISDLKPYFLLDIAKEIAKQNNVSLKNLFIPKIFLNSAKDISAEGISFKFFNQEVFLKLTSNFYFDISKVKSKLKYNPLFNLQQGIYQTLQNDI